MEEISLTINGRMLSCRTDSTLLEAARENGIRIPTLCHHPQLKPAGACRLCLVEDETSGRVMAACVTPVAQSLSVQTDSPRILKHRRNIIRLMMAEHPESCLVCNKGNRCRLRELAAAMGLGETGLYPMPNFKPVENLNPFIERDLSKCILCGKCIRADHERVVAGAIDYNLRGFGARPATLFEQSLENSTCTFCGTCVSMCPTGALSTKPMDYVGSPEFERETTCGFCGVGCSLLMGVSGERVVEINPSEIPGTVNGATLCVRGHFAHDYLNSKNRLVAPLIRKEGQLTPTTWPDALGTVAERLLEIRKAHGPQSIGFLGSSKCTNEENYLFQKLARTLLGTNNVDNLGGLAGRGSFEVLQERCGWGCRVAPMKDLERAEAILVMGADPDHSAPVLGYHLRRAAKRGIPLIGVDVRKTSLSPLASQWLCIAPGRDLDLVHCLTALLWKRFGHDAGYISRYTEGFEVFSEAISSFNPQRLCMAAGLGMSSLDRVVNLLKGRRISFVMGHGITRQQEGESCMEAILNLALMTGSLEQGAARIHMVNHENNQSGAWDMGSVPNALPGRQPLSDSTARKKWERAWKADISPDTGLDAIRMIREAEKGNLKALYVMGENPVRNLPQQNRVSKALAGLEFLVVQDILHTETTQLAQVVLPGAPFSEKNGSFTNMEGRINRFKPAVPPPFESLPDWRILDDLGTALGNPHPFGTIHRIREEIARFVPPYGALAESRDHGWGWIRAQENIRLFSPLDEGARIPFVALPKMQRETHEKAYPLTAVLGGERFWLGGGTRTESSQRIIGFWGDGTVKISAEDGRANHLEDGVQVRVRSRHGDVTRKVRIEKGLPRGILFLPFGESGNDAVNLLPLTKDKGLPYEGFNMCRIRLEKEGGVDGTKKP